MTPLITSQSAAPLMTDRFLYAELGDERELYDMEAHPWQLESRHDEPSFADERASLRDRIDELRGCAGASCR